MSKWENCKKRLTVWKCRQASSQGMGTQKVKQPRGRDVLLVLNQRLSSTSVNKHFNAQGVTRHEVSLREKVELFWLSIFFRRGNVSPPLDPGQVAGGSPNSSSSTDLLTPAAFGCRHTVALPVWLLQHLFHLILNLRQRGQSPCA